MNQPIGRRERKLQQTADKLVQTAWDLFEQQGFEQVTMESIAETADVAKGTLYKHFPVKEALLEQALHGELQQQTPQLLDRLQKIPAGKLRMQTFFQISADWSEQRRHYLPHYLVFRMRSGSRNRSGMEQIFKMLLKTGFEEGAFQSEQSIESCVHYLSFLYLGALLRWLERPGHSLTEELKTMLELFLNGIQKKTNAQ